MTRKKGAANILDSSQEERPPFGQQLRETVLAFPKMRMHLPAWAYCHGILQPKRRFFGPIFV
nr:hypothetical protein [Amylibacter sp.]